MNNDPLTPVALLETSVQVLHIQNLSPSLLQRIKYV